MSFCLYSLEVQCYLIVRCFFFQAEDGIRDLVRSRGLGDVYKRQALEEGRELVALQIRLAVAVFFGMSAMLPTMVVYPVSYTHLTLPTSDLV